MNKTAQHTPGPWTLDTSEPDGEIIVMDEQDVSIATCRKQPLDPSEWVEANAQLIAAAPDLLGALQDMVDDMEGRFGEIPDDCSAYHDAIKAIRKANGE